MAPGDELRLPWHDEAWARLAGALADDRLPQGLLIRGMPGLGGLQLALRLAAAALCEAPSTGGDACGRCRGCRWVAAGSHPDLVRVEPDKPEAPIRVDAVRELGETLALASHAGGRRVAVLAPADALNAAAANALLKTLEEPPAGTVLVLVTARAGRLPATVRSRCQVLALRPVFDRTTEAWLAERLPDGARAAEWLAAAGGAPLAALELAGSQRAELLGALYQGLAALGRGAEGPATVAARWLEAAEEWTLPGLRLLLAELARRAAGADSRWPAWIADEVGLGRARHLTQLVQLHDHVTELMRFRDRAGGPRLEALVEDAALAWRRLSAGKGATDS